MKRYVKLLSVIAVLLTVTLSVKPALAYFTTYTEAGGTMKVSLTEETEITEPTFKEWKKEIVISNKADANVSVYVRAIAYQPANMPALDYTGSEGWTLGSDGYWYYGAALAGGESAKPLYVQISGIPEEAAEGDTFNVVVVYECIPVQYDADGNALPPAQCDWSKAAKEG